MSLFTSRSRIAPTRGRLGLILVLLVLALGWRWWQRPHARHDLPQGTISGRLHVADGDSLSLSGERIRLLGIDAPELDQSCTLDGASRACGETARDHLVTLIAGRTVSCEWVKLDKYGRHLARCRAGDADLNAAMVRDGWAVAYGAYVDEEADARSHGRGLWAGRFEWPEDFRRDKRVRSGRAGFLDDGDGGDE